MCIFKINCYFGIKCFFSRRPNERDETEDVEKKRKIGVRDSFRGSAAGKPNTHPQKEQTAPGGQGTDRRVVAG